MRQQRAKRYRKAMALYQTSFSFREPYQILLSSDFILSAHRFKLNLPSLLERTFQAPLKLSTSPLDSALTPLNSFLRRINPIVITQCSISELYSNADQTP